MPSSMLSVAAPLAAEGELPLLAVSFSVQARAEPGVMPRVLELFAKRGLVPHKWHSTVSGSGSVLTIDVQLAGLGRDRADYIAGCMRQITGVETVLTSETGSPG